MMKNVYDDQCIAVHVIMNGLIDLRTVSSQQDEPHLGWPLTLAVMTMLMLHKFVKSYVLIIV
jgi:hypothetical protein